MDADSEDEEEGEEEAEGEEEEDLGPPVNTSLALFAKAPPKYPSAADCKKSFRRRTSNSCHCRRRPYDPSKKLYCKGTLTHKGKRYRSKRLVCKPPARWVATFRRRSAKPDGACVTKSQLMKSKAAPAKKPEVAPPKAAKAGEGQSLDLCDDPVFCPDTSDGDSASWTKLITEQDQLQEAEEQGGGALTSKDRA